MSVLYFWEKHLRQREWYFWLLGEHSNCCSAFCESSIWPLREAIKWHSAVQITSLQGSNTIWWKVHYACTFYLFEIGCYKRWYREIKIQEKLTFVPNIAFVQNIAHAVFLHIWHLASRRWWDKASFVYFCFVFVFVFSICLYFFNLAFVLLIVQHSMVFLHNWHLHIWPVRGGWDGAWFVCLCFLFLCFVFVLTCNVCYSATDSAAQFLHNWHLHIWPVRGVGMGPDYRWKPPIDATSRAFAKQYISLQCSG